MPNSLVISPFDYKTLRDHLLKNRTEQVAFCFAVMKQGEQGAKFDIENYYLANTSDYIIQSGYHITLTDEALGRIIKTAWDTKMVLVEMHSHPYHRRFARFSTSDLFGFKEFVPHIWWRLQGRPYLAVVFSQNDFDALAWLIDPNIPQKLDHLQVGTRTMHSTGITLNYLREVSYGQGTF